MQETIHKKLLVYNDWLVITLFEFVLQVNIFTVPEMAQPSGDKYRRVSSSAVGRLSGQGQGQDQDQGRSNTFSPTSRSRSCSTLGTRPPLNRAPLGHYCGAMKVCLRFLLFCVMYRT